MKKLAIAAATLIAIRYAGKFYFGTHAQIIVDRFPDLPEKEVRKAYDKIMKRALTDNDFHADRMTEEELDAYLRQLVKEQTSQN